MTVRECTSLDRFPTYDFCTELEHGCSGLTNILGNRCLSFRCFLM